MAMLNSQMVFFQLKQKSPFTDLVEVGRAPLLQAEARANSAPYVFNAEITCKISG